MKEEKDLNTTNDMNINITSTKDELKEDLKLEYEDELNEFGNNYENYDSFDETHLGIKMFFYLVDT